MSDFVGYARTNLFKVKDLGKFQEDLMSLGWPLSLLQHDSCGGFIWTGTESPFSESWDMSVLASKIKPHLLETVFIVVAGGLKGLGPAFECIAIDTSGKIKRYDLAQITKGHTVDFSDAPVIWIS